MKCPECGGVGRTHYGEEWCSACNGTGEVQNNEEWFCQLPTEEKAEFLSDVNVNEDFCGFCETKFRDCKPKECKYKNGYAEAWKKWLKEKHDGR